MNLFQVQFLALGSGVEYKVYGIEIHTLNIYSDDEISKFVILEMYQKA